MSIGLRTTPGNHILDIGSRRPWAMRMKSDATLTLGTESKLSPSRPTSRNKGRVLIYHNKNAVKSVSRNNETYFLSIFSPDEGGEGFAHEDTADPLLTKSNVES